MNSRATKRFWDCFEALPTEVQELGRTAFLRWQQAPNHPSLHFNQVYADRPIYSVRIGLAWRALGVKSNNTIVWYWIGSHAEYDRLLASR